MKKRLKFLSRLTLSFAIIAFIIFGTQSHIVNHTSAFSQNFYGYGHFFKTEKVIETSHDNPKFWGVPEL